MIKYNNNNSVRLIYFDKYSIKNRICIKEIGKKYFYFKKIELIFVWIVPPLIDRYLPKKMKSAVKSNPLAIKFPISKSIIASRSSN